MQQVIVKLICTHVQARCVCTVVCHSLSLCLHVLVVILTRLLFQSSRKLTMHAANNWCMLLINFGCHNVMCTLICSCTKQGKGVAVYSGQQSMYQWKTSVNNKLKLHVEKQSVMKWLVFSRFQIAGKCCQFEQYHPISLGPCTCSVQEHLVHDCWCMGMLHVTVTCQRHEKSLWCHQLTTTYKMLNPPVDLVNESSQCSRVYVYQYSSLKNHIWNHNYCCR